MTKLPRALGLAATSTLLLGSCRPPPEPPASPEEEEFVLISVGTPIPREEHAYPPPEGMKEALNLSYVPTECFGPKINLHHLGDCDCQGLKDVPGRGIRVSYCGDAFYDVDLTDAIDVRLVPHQETVPVHGKVYVELVIENRTEDVVPIILSFEIMYQLSFDVILVVDEHGNDVTRRGARGGGNRGGEVLFALEPHGQAILGMNWTPATIVGEWSTEGNLSRLHYSPEWLPPGKYTLRFKVPFYSTLGVTEEQRLPSTTITVVPEPPEVRESP